MALLMSAECMNKCFGVVPRSVAQTCFLGRVWWHGKSVCVPRESARGGDNRHRVNVGGGRDETVD